MASVLDFEKNNVTEWIEIDKNDPKETFLIIG